MNILIAETSAIVFEGLNAIFQKSGINPGVSKVVSFDEIERNCTRKNVKLIIMNPAFVQNNVKAFHTLRNQFGTVKWVGLVYAYYDQTLLSMFDSIIAISDTSDNIRATITRLLQSDSQRDQNSMQELLSDRETDVLKLLAGGMSNKEIADKLNISTNTVITHRKNITQKTGIKSVSGLTIYAVVQKIITLDAMME